uniref:EF-hand domain-containing protein n=1 Tax=Romanomermis culicivorax TaxID=13658 RepID=A0A915LAP1_ROMCU
MPVNRQMTQKFAFEVFSTTSSKMYSTSYNLPNLKSGSAAAFISSFALGMYDIDGNGTIEEKEMIKIIEAIYEMLGPEVTRNAEDSPSVRAKMIFEKMDLNKDRKLTQQEFISGCLSDKDLYQILTSEVRKS